jgi:hypothetical protein
VTRAKSIPAVGSLVRPVGSDLVYRVVEAFKHGCCVEAVSTEVRDVPGRAARPRATRKSVPPSHAAELIACDGRTAKIPGRFELKK